jgi:hypothetical protein
MSYKVLKTEVWEDGKWSLISGTQKMDKASTVNVDPAKFFLDGMKGKPIGKIVSCVENDEGLTVTIQREIKPIETINKITKVIKSKSTDKKKVQKIELILSA